MTDTAPGAPTTGLSQRQIYFVFAGLMLGMFLAALDQTVVATALPTIVGDLGGLNHLSWVVTSYLLASTVSTPLWGKLGDLYGRKGFFQAAIVIFLVGSALSGLSQNLNELIAFRALQGLGAGGLIVGAQAIIGDIVPLRDRGRYSGLMAGTFAISSVAGPLLGGFFTDSLSWRWVFYINLPTGALALLVVAAALHARTTHVEHKIDYLGAGITAAMATSLILMLTWGGTTYAWDSAMIVGLGVATVVLFGLMIVVEQRATEPVVPLRLFRISNFRVSFTAGVVVAFSMFGATTFLPLFLQVVHGASPTSSGLQMVPIMAFMLLMSVYVGRRMSITGRYRTFPIIGTVLVALGLYLLSFLDAHTPFWQTAIYMAVLGAGLGSVMQVLLVICQNSVEYSDLGVGTSLAAFGRSIGGALGVAVFGTIFNNRLAVELPKHLPAAALSRIHGASVTANPAAVNAMPAPIRHGIQLGFADSLHLVFLAAVPFGLLALVLALRIHEQPLRTAGAESGPAFEGPAIETATADGMPISAEAVSSKSPARSR
ncbi:MAG TPA: MDR family MFS transporter [Mycobacteriales bacterium]|nr:MDR family MFS transporter [Mycobacteriales bacterium]